MTLQSQASGDGNTMSEIPADIRIAAFDAFVEGKRDPGARVTHIANAILAERQRAEAVADLYISMGWRGSELPAAIRNGVVPHSAAKERGE